MEKEYKKRRSARISEPEKPVETEENVVEEGDRSTGGRPTGEMAQPSVEESQAPVEEVKENLSDHETPKTWEQKTPAVMENWIKGKAGSFVMDELSKTHKVKFSIMLSMQFAPYYFSLKDLSEQERTLALAMLHRAGVYPYTTTAHKNLGKIKKGEEMWVVGRDPNKKIGQNRKQVNKLEKFFKECKNDEEKRLGTDLKQELATHYANKKEESDKGSRKEGGARKEIWEGTKEQVKDVAAAVNQALNSFNAGDNFQDMGFALLGLLPSILSNLIEIKAAKLPKVSKVEDQPYAGPSDNGGQGDQKRQMEAMKQFAQKMAQKDAGLLPEMAQKGAVLGQNAADKNTAQQGVLSWVPQKFVAENPKLWQRFAKNFVETAQENPKLYAGIFPAGYQGKVSPQDFLKQMAQAANMNVRTDVHSGAQQGQPQVDPAMAEALAVIKGLKDELQSIRTQLDQLQKDNEQLKTRLDQVLRENADLRAQMEIMRQENAALRAANEALKEQKGPGETYVKDPSQPSVQPDTEIQKVPDLERLGELHVNQSGKKGGKITSEFRAIMSDAFHDVCGKTSEQLKTAEESGSLDPKKGEVLMNEIRKAYDVNGTIEGLNDKVKTPEDIQFAKKFALAVATDDGHDVPNRDMKTPTTASVAPEVVPENTQNEQMKALKKVKEQYAQAVKNGEMPVFDFEQIANMLPEGPKTDLLEFATKLNKRVKEHQAKEAALTDAEKLLIESREGLKGITLAKDSDTLVNISDGTDVSDEQLKKILKIGPDQSRFSAHVTSIIGAQDKLLTRQGLTNLFIKLSKLNSEVAVSNGLQLRQTEADLVRISQMSQKGR